MSVDVLEMDAQKMLDEVVVSMEESLGEILNPGDERRIVAGNILAVLIAAASQVNHYANSQLIAYAKGDMLELLGEFVGAVRLPATAAGVTIEFKGDPPAGTQVNIPKGTRVTPDGSTFFAIKTSVVLSAESPTALVKAEALQLGSSLNGYPIGSVNVIVDPVPYILSCTNIDVSAGGADAEGDDDYRERMRLAPSTFSVAGPKGAYEYWAKTANAYIGDVSVSSPAPMQVVVTILMRDGTLPPQSVVDEVKKVLSADDVRPLTDEVIVKAAEETLYDINLSYYISSEDSGSEQIIKTECEKALSEYVLWQAAKLGRSVNPDKLRQLLLAAGAHRVELTSPAYSTIQPHEVARAQNINFEYGGVVS